ncbi:hypothetical protein GY14_32225 [Delftia tsuruhatensis]|nr:hypothetical protein GY14_32225 [Delftia tsuruhatensis]
MWIFFEGQKINPPKINLIQITCFVSIYRNYHLNTIIIKITCFSQIFTQSIFIGSNEFYTSHTAI